MLFNVYLEVLIEKLRLLRKSLAREDVVCQRISKHGGGQKKCRRYQRKKYSLRNGRKPEREEGLGRV
jgi:hypothetical protein